jgi:hypothetical protein
MLMASQPSEWQGLQQSVLKMHLPDAAGTNPKQGRQEDEPSPNADGHGWGFPAASFCAMPAAMRERTTADRMRE